MRKSSFTICKFMWCHCLELGADSSNIRERVTLQVNTFFLTEKRGVKFSNDATSKIKTKLNPDKFQHTAGLRPTVLNKDKRDVKQ